MLNIKKTFAELAEIIYANEKVEAGTITAESNISLENSDSFVYKVGNVCHVQIRFGLKTATTTNTKIATLSEGFRPRVTSSNGLICNIIRLWGFNKDHGTAYIQANGNVMLSANYVATTTNDYLLSATFIV